MSNQLYTYGGFGLHYNLAACKKIILGLNPGTRTIEVKSQKAMKQAIKDTKGSREVLIIVQFPTQRSEPRFDEHTGKPVAPAIITNPGKSVVACNGISIDTHYDVKPGATLREVVESLEEDGTLCSLLPALLPDGIYADSPMYSVIIKADPKHSFQVNGSGKFEITLEEAVAASHILEPLAMQFHKMGLPLVSPRFISESSWE